MKSLLGIAALILTINTSSVWANYIGPNGSPTSVQQLLEYGRDHDIVVLQGHIVSRSTYHNVYQFSDGTGTVLIGIDNKEWPIGMQVDDKTRVEIFGKFDKEVIGFKIIKVKHIRIVN